MTINTSNRQFYLNHLLRMILSVALVFATFHVVFHELDISNNHSDTEECQFCRINNVPFTLQSVPDLVVPLFLLSSVLIIPAFQQPTLNNKHILGARAPPLF